MDFKNRIKQIDELGRIVIPKDIRKGLDINPGDEVEIFARQDSIVLRKAVERCVFCGKEEGLIKYKGLCVCAACRQELFIQG